MENLSMGFGVSGMMLAVVFLIVWVIQFIMKKDKTVSITGLKFSVILFLAGLLLSVGIGFTIVLALIVGILYFILKKKKDSNAPKNKHTFWNIPFRSKPKAVMIAAAVSLCITVWATVDVYRTADTITVDSPSAEINIEDKQESEEEEAAKGAEQKAAEEAAAKEAEQKAAEEATAKEAEQKAAEEAAAKEAEQKAAEEAAAKEAEQKAAEESATIEAEKKAAEEAATIEAEQDTEEYVLNTSTKKFHHSWCSSVNRIKASNYSTCIGRDTAIAMGYTSCGNCNP